MKILIATTYIYDPAMPEFTKNKTGFGMMVRDIFSAVSETNEVYLISNVLTQGHGKYIMKHTLADVIKYSRPKDWILGIKWFFQYKQGIRSRIQYLYYGLNRGYVRKILRELNPDLVHIHGLSQASKMCMEACDEMKIPYVVTLHGLIGLDETVHAPAWEKEYEKEFLCIAEERNIPVTVISTGMKKRIEKKYLGHEVHNITVITNGTKISSNTVEVNKLTNIKEQFSVQGEYKIALTIGSICERKNQMQILDAMEQLKADERLNFVVFFCGVDATNSTFQHKIEEKNLQDNAIMLGFVERECLDQLMEQADLNIVASKDEGFGLSIIEAYSHGLPTVTFADLDAVENLYDEQAMVVADERSTEALADAIYQAVERRWDRSYIRRVSSNYSLEKMADEYEQKYRAILNGGGNTACVDI